MVLSNPSLAFAYTLIYRTSMAMNALFSFQLICTPKFVRQLGGSGHVELIYGAQKSVKDALLVHSNIILVSLDSLYGWDLNIIQL